MKKRIINFISIVLTISLLYVCLAYLNFRSSEKTTNINQALHAKDQLTIIYRDGCGRCRRTLPIFFLQHTWEMRKVNVINAKTLSKKQLAQFHVKITPVFYLNGKGANTTDLSKINSIYRKSE